MTFAQLLSPIRLPFRRLLSTMPFTYEEAVTKIVGLQTNAAVLDALRKAGPRMNDKSLPEMRDYLRRIGYEPKDLDCMNIIHVTGTKGKGSTCALTQSVLHNWTSPDGKPLKTGLFTSPHLVAMRERIRIDGAPISEDLFAKYTEDVWNRLEATKDQAAYLQHSQDPKKIIKNQLANPDKPAYFRFLTLVAFHAMMQEKVDVAILEVGVGGEYDSTNIVENPIVCGITALGLDHVTVLGNTIDSIAWHKAGIIKNKVPAIAFNQVPEAIEVIKQRAAEKEAPLQIVYPENVTALDHIEIGLHGVHQRYNALVAVELCKIWLEKCRGVTFEEPQGVVPASFFKGLKEVKWPGRGQVMPVQDTKYASEVQADTDLKWYLDGAHTAESLQVCAEWFKDTVKEKTDSTKRVLVFNCTHGRDGLRLLDSIAAIHKVVQFDHAVFSTNVTFKKGYTADSANFTVAIDEKLTLQHELADAWLKLVPEFPQDQIHYAASVEEAVLWSVDFSQKAGLGQKTQVLSTGSLIMVGNTLTVMDIPPQ
ncbi:Mur ligase [Umbelopsis sp. AD052]|nr:Mur ligase [Umbelopsis sp. AD052]